MKKVTKCKCFGYNEDGPVRVFVSWFLKTNMPAYKNLIQSLLISLKLMKLHYIGNILKFSL